MTQFFLEYAPYIVFLGFVFVIFIWSEWQWHVVPMLIPKEHIDVLVDELIAKHGDGADEAAHRNEDRAWRYSDTLEQGKWRRVRAEIDRRDNFRGTIR